MICKHFARTGRKLPKKHTIADECKACKLREETINGRPGDCPEDIWQDVGEELSKIDSTILSEARERVNKIWERFNERNCT